MATTAKAPAKTTTARKAPAKRAPKAPQDRAPKTVRFENTPAGKLMRPLNEIPFYEREALIELSYEFEDIEAQALELQEANDEKGAYRLLTKAVLRFSKELKQYSVDPKAYDVFLSGGNAGENAFELVMGWMTEVGK